MLTQNDINILLGIISNNNFKGDDENLDVVYQLKCKLKAMRDNQDKTQNPKVIKE